MGNTFGMKSKMMNGAQAARDAGEKIRGRLKNQMDDCAQKDEV